jgi:hypothetical protein
VPQRISLSGVGPTISNHFSSRRQQAPIAICNAFCCHAGIEGARPAPENVVTNELGTIARSVLGMPRHIPMRPREIVRRDELGLRGDQRQGRAWPPTSAALESIPYLMGFGGKVFGKAPTT